MWQRTVGTVGRFARTISTHSGRSPLPEGAFLSRSQRLPRAGETGSGSSMPLLREGQRDMKRRDTQLRLKRFRVDEFKRRMTTLDAMKSDLERKLADLEDSVARERQRS